MHDPHTLAFSIKYPWYPRYKMKDGTTRKGEFRSDFITIWHVDPEKDGTDDSCGWFMRSRHGDKKVLEEIVKAFEYDWDRTFTSDGTGKTYNCGYFYPQNAGAGMPVMSVMGIVLNLFFIAACKHFGCDGRSNWKKANKFMQKNLFDILHFAENPSDSLFDGITRKFGCDEKREERIRSMAHCIYSWILSRERPWYRHPKWHFWHWQIQCHPYKAFLRWAFSRCNKCSGVGVACDDKN